MNEMKITWKEMIVAYFNVTFKYFSVGSGDKYENPELKGCLHSLRRSVHSPSAC
jgi:hypothetical protein